jgi:serine/threonine-protein kinase
MNTVSHLSQHDLWQVLCDPDASELEQRVQDHVTDCVDCRRRLESLAASPQIWQQASQVLTEDGVGETLALTSRFRRHDHEPQAVPLHGGSSLKSLLDPPTHPEMLGRLAHYEIEREIGRGGMGVVLKAHDTELHRAVAIKMMAPHLANFGVARQRFAREARSAAAVLHPNVIAIHAVSTESRTPWLVMPYIVGPSLEQVVRDEGALDEQDVVSIAMQIAAGLAAAHSQGVVHRDIKPANVLIENGMGRVVITDFGLARAESDASMTHTGWFAGTPNFMSPEQALGREIDHRSDLFSLGSVMYYMATGRLPFRGEGPMAVLAQIREHDPAAPRSVNPKISATLSNLIQRLLARDPCQRIQTAAQVHQLLEKFLAHLNHPESRPQPVVKPPAPPRNGRSGWWVAAAACGLLAIVAGWWLNRLPPAAAPLTFEAVVTRHGLQRPETFDESVAELDQQILALEAALQVPGVAWPDSGEDSLWQEMSQLQNRLRSPPPWNAWQDDPAANHPTKQK